MAHNSLDRRRDSYSKVHYGYGRDVLIIVSEDVSGATVVQRRPAIDLDEELSVKLESQGIELDDQFDDLSIVKARHQLDKDCTVTGVEMSGLAGGERLTRGRVLKQIITLMNNYNDKTGVVLYYIGAGRKGTGDWCFEDGFITFRDLTRLYLQLLRGRVLTIVSDCSHSGNWVRECMTFLDEEGVKPCGHSARDKGILIKVFASCLAYQVPRQLAFSVHTCVNDVETGDLSFSLCSSISSVSMISDEQYTRGIDSTEVSCGREFIYEDCLCLPQANWQIWREKERVRKVRGQDRGHRAWHVILVVDDEKSVVEFLEKLESDQVNVKEFGRILKSGWGEDVPQDTMESVLSKYSLYRKEDTDETDSMTELQSILDEGKKAADRKRAQSVSIGLSSFGKSSLFFAVRAK